MKANFFHLYFEDIHAHLTAVDHSELESVVSSLEQKKAGARVYFVGNGGSSAMASHAAVDLTKNTRLRGLTFNEYDLITCFANDFGYEQWVAQAIQRFAEKGDVLVAVSSSGNSENIVNAIKQAHEIGMEVITLSGFQSDNKINGTGRFNFWVNSSHYNYVEMVHHIILVSIIDRLISLET